MFKDLAVHFYRPLRGILFYCLFFLLFSGVAGAAEPIPERFLSIDGKISEDGASIELNWGNATGTNVDRVTIQ